MIQDFTFEAAGKSYTVSFTARARYLFEQLAGYPLVQIAAIRGTVSDVELPRLILAGLEGHRTRTKSRKAAWTLDEVLDDVVGDLGPKERLDVLSVCLEAVSAAFSAAGATEAAEGAAGKAPTTV